MTDSFVVKFMFGLAMLQNFILGMKLFEVIPPINIWTSVFFAVWNTACFLWVDYHIGEKKK